MKVNAEMELNIQKCCWKNSTDSSSGGISEECDLEITSTNINDTALRFGNEISIYPPRSRPPAKQSNTDPFCLNT